MAIRIVMEKAANGRQSNLSQHPFYLEYSRIMDFLRYSILLLVALLFLIHLPGNVESFSLFDSSSSTSKRKRISTTSLPATSGGSGRGSRQSSSGGSGKNKIPANLKRKVSAARPPVGNVIPAATKTKGCKFFFTAQRRARNHDESAFSVWNHLTLSVSLSSI